MTLGQTIHRLRLEHGLSQADLADRLEVSRQSISKWETDSSVPELDKLIALSRIFGVTLDELVGHTPDMPASPAPEAASDSTPDPAKSAPTTLPLRKLMGILLLFFGGTVFLFFALPGRSLANGLVYCAPLAVSGVLCLACRRPGPSSSWPACYWRSPSAASAMGSSASPGGPSPPWRPGGRCSWPSPFWRIRSA